MNHKGDFIKDTSWAYELNMNPILLSMALRLVFLHWQVIIQFKFILGLAAPTKFTDKLCSTIQIIT